MVTEGVLKMFQRWEEPSLLPWRWWQNFKSFTAVRDVAQSFLEKSDWWRKKNISAILKSESEATWNTEDEFERKEVVRWTKDFW